MNILPHSKDSEQCVLGCMLIDDSTINLATLEEEDFYESKHWIIYKAMKLLKEHKGKSDMIMVKELLESNGKLDSIGGVLFITELTEIVPTTSNFSEYISIVKEKSNRRRMIQLAREIETAGFDESENIKKYLGSIENIGKDVLRIEDDSGSGYEELCEDYSNLRDRYNTMGAMGEAGPYKYIDKATQGIIPGTVQTIVAYSNVGKSNFTYSLVTDALKRGKKVLFFSNEVMKDLLFTNIIKYHNHKTFGELMHKDYGFEPSDFRNLKIHDQVIKLEEIELITKSSDADYVFIDFIQNIQTQGSGEYEKMTKVAQNIQRLAITTGKTIFSVSQANNESRFKGGDKIQPKGSGAIFASSDVILALSRTQIPEILNLNILKNKFGPADLNFELHADFNKGMFQVSKQIQDLNTKPQS